MASKQGSIITLYDKVMHKRNKLTRGTSNGIVHNIKDKCTYLLFFCEMRKIIALCIVSRQFSNYKTIASSFIELLCQMKPRPQIYKTWLALSRCMHYSAAIGGGVVYWFIGV